MREPVKEFAGKIYGWREDKGDRIVAYAFSGKQLGYYDKSRNCTCEFGGRVICSGDATTALILKDGLS